MSRICETVSGNGSKALFNNGAGIETFGCLICHSYHNRSIIAWCAQNTGSNAAIGMSDIDPPTQP
jgi:hypothetical protein